MLHSCHRFEIKLLQDIQKEDQLTQRKPWCRALTLGLIFLAAEIMLVPTPTMASTSLQPLTYRGPTLDELRVVVQVSIVVRNRTLIKLEPVVSVPTARSEFINMHALPVLQQEALRAQSANISWVSGATTTSRAYVTSLQAALSKARRAQAL
jgi:uncharacterized protein with FMN-binding domain